MTIDYHRKPTTQFCNIKKGEVFLDDDGDALMKIEDVRATAGPKIYNAIDLRTGYAYFISDPQDVVPCPDACLSIE